MINNSKKSPRKNCLWGSIFINLDFVILHIYISLDELFLYKCVLQTEVPFAFFSCGCSSMWLKFFRCFTKSIIMGNNFNPPRYYPAKPELIYFSSCHKENTNVLVFSCNPAAHIVPLAFYVLIVKVC
jgi:hypothetical protein